MARSKSPKPKRRSHALPDGSVASEVSTRPSRVEVNVEETTQTGGVHADENDGKVKQPLPSPKAVTWGPTTTVILPSESSSTSSSSSESGENSNGAKPVAKETTTATRWRFYDSSGAGPITRFLRADDPTRSWPTLRVLIMLMLGFLLSASVIWLSEDEFFEGTMDRRQSEHIFDFPVHIAFKDVGCLVGGMSEPALFNLTGSIPAGKLTGVLGQSGSGKTLLSYQLLGRGRKFCSQGSKGQVYLNGRPRSLEAFLDRVGFVPQDDILYGDLTVEETIQFSANWRLPRAVTDREKADIINETISLLNLNRVRNSKVGCTKKRGVSGGERRRVSIGMELVAKPSVLIAPTTGLDGAGAYQLVKALRGFVDSRNGFVSIVVVLHQPSARVFDLLHNVILMSRGSMVFSGPPKEATAFLAECGFVYQAERDAQNRSAAEYILDVLSGEESGPEGVQGVDGVAKLLHRKWKEKFEHDRGWEKIEGEMARYRKREMEILKELHQEAGEDVLRPNANSFLTQLFKASGLLDHCRDPQHQAELWCVVFFGTPFPVLPKPGLRKQLHLWFWQIMVRITWRRGFLLHLFVIHSLANTVAFVRSFNQSWSRRPHANFVLSIVISLLGMLSAVFNDEIGPVQRAASSGMILAAHELAQLAHTLIVGWFQCHWFAISYFTFLWLRSGVWCCAPFRFDKYYEFTHILHLHYLVSSGIGSCICAMTGHDLRASFITTIGALMHFHVFALFSPSRNQAERDTKILFGKIDISPLVLFYAKWSYVRYSQEALMLWEPDVENDKIARNFTLRYFSWEEQNFVADLTWLFTLWTIATSSRFVFFAIGNANAYNSAYDIPLFLLFLGKVIILHLTTLIMMVFVHEFYTTWREAKLLLKDQQQLDEQRQREAEQASSTANGEK